MVFGFNPLWFLFQLLDAVADCMAFGALEKCPECKEGQLVYRSVHIEILPVHRHMKNVHGASKLLGIECDIVMNQEFGQCLHVAWT